MGRRSIRIPGYDYGGVGAYFVTVVTHERARLFGSITDGTFNASLLGTVAASCWREIPAHQPHAIIGDFVVMPDHFHGIIEIRTSPHARAFETFTGRNQNTNVRSPAGVALPLPPSQTIGSIVRGFKIGVTRWARAHTTIDRVWHRNYHERIIRDERAMIAVRRYIAANPARWRG